VTRFRFPLDVSLVLLLVASRAAGTPPVDAPLLVPDGGKDAALSLGVRAETGDARNELLGFLSLSVPLERLAAPRAAGRSAAAANSVPDVVETPRESPPPAPPAPPRSLAPRPFEPSALSALARGALAAARLAERSPERERALDGIASRARLSALLPEVRVRAARTRDESLRLTPTTDDPYRFTLAGGDALVLEGAMTFRLTNLLFADEELAVERLRIERERNAERRVARVLERLLAWHAALVRLETATEEDDRARIDLERVAAVVELDVLTDGWFGPRAKAFGPRRDGQPSAPPDARLDPPGVSATPCSSCLPMHETGSRTSKGASMR
jgi:hypothetical protein